MWLRSFIKWPGLANTLYEFGHRVTWKVGGNASRERHNRLSNGEGWTLGEGYSG